MDHLEVDVIEPFRRIKEWGEELTAPIAQLLGIEIIEVGTVKLLGHSPFIKAESTFMLHSSVDNNINQDRA